MNGIIYVLNQTGMALAEMEQQLNAANARIAELENAQNIKK